MTTYSRMHSSAIKLSSPETREFWEIPILFRDDYLLVLNKPAGLALTAESESPRPALLKLLHEAVAQSKASVRELGLSFVMNAHRLDAEASGVLLLARDKTVLATLTNLFGSDTQFIEYTALVQNVPAEPAFEVDAPIGPHQFKAGLMQLDPHHGKKARTTFEVVETFQRYALVTCRPVPDRPHQVRVHLRRAGSPVVGDRSYGGRLLMLSSLKSDYRLKGDKEERPLIQSPALHASVLALPHPVTGEPLRVEAPWPKDLAVAVKYLKRYRSGGEPGRADEFSSPAK